MKRPIAKQRAKVRALRHRLLVHRRAGEHARRLLKAYNRSLAALAQLRRRARRNGPHKALVEARRHVGETERPPGSNHISFAVEFGIDGQPWCGAFVGHCLRKAGVVVPQGIVYTPNIPHFKGWPVVHAPHAGDLALFDFNGDGVIQHVGLVISGRTKDTYEGNTSFDDGGSQDNGGAVAHKHRGGAGVACYVRPPYPVAR